MVYGAIWEKLMRAFERRDNADPERDEPHRMEVMGNEDGLGNAPAEEDNMGGD